MNIPHNNGLIQLTGLLVLAKETKSGSKFVQVLVQETDTGIEGKLHLIGAWHPANYEECLKLVDKPVTFPALRGMGDNLYRCEKNVTFSPLKG
ncbi:MAG: hypothetical protein O4860_13700 [Trichodesmium sp. St2_bin2_1]|nr:hypothetical protein [Trichodesmium sp. St2_bin2_1]